MAEKNIITTLNETIQKKAWGIVFTIMLVYVFGGAFWAVIITNKLSLLETQIASGTADRYYASQAYRDKDELQQQIDLVSDKLKAMKSAFLVHTDDPEDWSNSAIKIQELERVIKSLEKKLPASKK